MESNWAAEHLQVIRTLMERTAVYRRALAPVMIYTGAVGVIAAVIGWACKIEAARSFVVFWAAVSAVALGGSFLLVRRQALKESEPFWSPPTRRVSQAFLAPLVAGSILSLGFLGQLSGTPAPGQEKILFLLPPAWVVLYGCALHSAGFFMPRGIKLFGWAFVIGGCGLFAWGIPAGVGWLAYGHGVMGAFFGCLHFAYGVYLYFTEPTRNET